MGDFRKFSAAWRRAVRITTFVLCLSLASPALASQEWGPAAAFTRLGSPDQTLCTDGRTPAGISFCDFFEAFSHELREPDFQEHLSELATKQEANPKDATLLYRRLMAESLLFGPSREGIPTPQHPEAVAPLADMARAANDKPLAVIAELLRLNSTTFDRAAATKLALGLVTAMTSADEAAAAFPEESQRLYFRARARLAAYHVTNAFLWDDTLSALHKIYLADAKFYLRKLYEADRNNVARLEQFNFVFSLGNSYEYDYNTAFEAERIALGEQLARLKPDDLAVKENLLDLYQRRAFNALKSNDMATAKADIAKMENTLAGIKPPAKPADMDAKDYSANITLLKATVMSREEPAKAGDFALEALTSGAGLPQQYVEIIANSAVSLMKNGRRDEAIALRDKAIAALEPLASRQNGNLALSFLNSYAAQLDQLRLKDDVAAVNRLRLPLLQSEPIRTSIEPYFSIIADLAKSDKSPSAHKALTQSVLAYVSDDRLAAAQITDSRAYSGPPLRQATLNAADQLNEIGNIFYKADNNREAVLLFRREAELRARYLPPDASGLVIRRAATTQFDLYYALSDAGDYTGALSAAERHLSLRRTALEKRPFGSEELIRYGRALNLVYMAADDVPGSAGKRAEVLAKMPAVADLLVRKYASKDEAVNTAMLLYFSYGVALTDKPARRLEWDRKAADLGRTMLRNFDSDDINLPVLVLAAESAADRLADLKRNDEAQNYFRIALDASNAELAAKPGNLGILKRRGRLLRAYALLASKDDAGKAALLGRLLVETLEIAAPLDKSLQKDLADARTLSAKLNVVAGK